MVFRAQTYTKIREFTQFADKKNNGKTSYIRCIAENMKKWYSPHLHPRQSGMP